MHPFVVNLFSNVVIVCVGLGVASLLIALLVRVLFTFVCVLCAGFNMREKLFIALAWMPKATVQVRQQYDQKQIEIK